MQQRANIRRTFTLLSQHSNPSPVLFKTDAAVTSALKPDADIFYLFLSLHAYHNLFSDFLVDILASIHKSEDTVDTRLSTLLRSLYSMVIWVAQRNDLLIEFLKEPRPTASTSCSPLFRFCGSIDCLVNGDGPIVLTKFRSRIRDIDSYDCNLAYKYFKVLLSLAAATANQKPEEKLIKNVKKDVSSVALLKPM